MSSSIFIFLTTNVLFSTVIYVCLVRLIGDRKYSFLELFIYSLGTGPIFTALVLYYLFLIFPHHSNVFYLVSIILIYLLLSLFGIRSFKIIYDNLKDTLTILRQKYFKLSSYRKILVSFVYFTIVVVFVSFLGLYIDNALSIPLDGHDALGYGVMGNVLFREKSLNPIWVNNFSQSGFIYLAKHPPSFSLLLTWEKTLGGVSYANKDLYFRSISPYYSFLILLVVYYWCSKVSVLLGLLGIAVLLSSPLFFLTIFSYHIDSFRIFFLIVSWIWLGYTTKSNDFYSLLLFGLFAGFAAFSHSIGMIIAGISCVALLLFLKDSWRNKCIKTMTGLSLIMLFGGVHYVMDVLRGRGWYLPEILRFIHFVSINFCLHANAYDG